MSKSNQNHNQNQKNQNPNHQKGQNPNQKKKKHNPVSKAAPRPQNIGRKFRNIRQKVRRAIEEESAGGVIFRRNTKGEVEILMIQDPKDRWSIPKGKIEKGESMQQAAEREVKEETGLKHIKVLDRLGKVDFRFRNGDALVLKTMHVFLMHAYKDADKYHAEEHEGIKDLRWFSVSEALDLIEYDDIGKLFLIALKKIRDGKY